jgi:hypothetical protein
MARQAAVSDRAVEDEGQTRRRIARRTPISPTDLITDPSRNRLDVIPFFEP